MKEIVIERYASYVSERVSATDYTSYMSFENWRRGGDL
jgi:hypothetical protein